MKRLFDICCALLGMVVLSPILLAVAIAVKMTSPGPVIFKQRRVGLHRVEFNLYKFRTMRSSAPSDVPTHMLDRAEIHITPLGRLLRRTSLDELPQLVNILRGDMSVVGPRPALWNQHDLVHERERYGANDVLPGLTGWAQVNGRDELSIAEKAALDGYYVENQGFLFDLKCIAASVAPVLNGSGVVDSGQQDERG